MLSSSLTSIIFFVLFLPNHIYFCILCSFPRNLSTTFLRHNKSDLFTQCSFLCFAKWKHSPPEFAISERHLFEENLELQSTSIAFAIIMNVQIEENGEFNNVEYDLQNDRKNIFIYQQLKYNNRKNYNFINLMERFNSGKGTIWN